MIQIERVVGADGAGLSIVVQGPLKKETDERGFSTVSVMESARRFYPAAEIIYSGWSGENSPNELYGLSDKVVLSTDPGPVQIFVTKDGVPHFENINRQIASTVAGLKAATNAWAIKMRSDTLIVRNQLSAWTELQQQKARRVTLFKLPLIASSKFTRLLYHERGDFHGCLGHVSDLFFFGLKNDLLHYWNGPFLPQSQDVNDFNGSARMEQILGIRCLVNCGMLPVGSRITHTQARRVGDLDGARWADLLEANFIVLEEAGLGVRHPARFHRMDLSRFAYESEYSISAWRGRLGYRKYIWFYCVKFGVFLVYQLKSAFQRLVGNRHYGKLTSLVYSLYGRRR